MLQGLVVKCPNCQSNVTIHLSNTPLVLNGPYVSMVMWQHPKHAVCPGCQVTLSPAVESVAKVTAIAQTVAAAEEENRVLVPDGYLAKN